MRMLITHILAGYIGAGFFAASLIGSSIPAMNAAGMAYITATWPILVYCAPKSRGCDGMPPEWIGKYMFSFTESP